MVDLRTIHRLVYRNAQRYGVSMAQDVHSFRQTFHRGSSALAR